MWSRHYIEFDAGLTGGIHRHHETRDKTLDVAVIRRRKKATDSEVDRDDAPHSPREVEAAKWLPRMAVICMTAAIAAAAVPKLNDRRALFVLSIGVLFAFLSVGALLSEWRLRSFLGVAMIAAGGAAFVGGGLAATSSLNFANDSPQSTSVDPVDQPGNLRTAALLRDRDLQGWSLAGADLSGLDLTHTSFADANLRGANFRHAILAGADLSGACLRGADFSDATVDSATNFDGADLAGAILGPVAAPPTSAVASRPPCGP